MESNGRLHITLIDCTCVYLFLSSSLSFFAALLNRWYHRMVTIQWGRCTAARGTRTVYWLECGSVFVLFCFSSVLCLLLVVVVKCCWVEYASFILCIISFICHTIIVIFISSSLSVLHIVRFSLFLITSFLVLCGMHVHSIIAH